jgi:hypothetical protein
MADLDDELLERVARWCAEAGRQAGPAEIRRALGALGVPESQMEAVSLGEERPRATGSDEASWAENRRADLVYQ